MSEKMWGSEPFWGLGYDWDPDWVLTDRQQELRATLIELCEKELRANAKRSDDELLFPRRNLEILGEHGFLGLTVPEEYGGHELGNLAMILTTEELSRASLAAAGSLITRPEILAKALLAGGTDEKKRTWLPRIAQGQRRVAISVTEPNTGSDVAAVSCRATRTTLDGVEGYFIEGAKAWCTFAGRADVIALLEQTTRALSGAA